jgi:multicomponent Na+:H+ antiporter subunit C
MTAIQLYLVLGAAVFLLGLHGMLTLSDPVRRLIAVNLSGAGTFLVMVTLARRIDPPDPVLHALVVTGLVVAVSATAFALRLIAASLAPEPGPKQEEKPAERPTP